MDEEEFRKMFDKELKNIGDAIKQKPTWQYRYTNDYAISWLPGDRFEYWHNRKTGMTQIVER